MDQAIRNKLRSVVTQCRRLLEESITQQLQGKYDIYATGKKDEVRAEEDVPLGHLTDEEPQARQDILAHFKHIEALGYKRKETLEQLIREIAFTHLNRLCAYKMMEVRDVYVGGQKFREAVSKGLKSQGFLFYLADHPDDEKRYKAGHQEGAYRHFLNWLGDTLSQEIGVLFSPTDPANRVYPPQRVLDEVLDLLNSEELKGIWSEDETIGWVYQYFTPKELRDQARKESQAPRNSYELAFRNQFFTPRYVVEFLTDNTLGRIWYEMRKGNTRLKDQCYYIVRRPGEVFFSEKENEPGSPVRLMRDSLLGGTEETLPPFNVGETERLVHLAHTVDGYERHPFGDQVEGEWWPWAKLKEIRDSGELPRFSTQDLLDVLFCQARADRHGGGYGDWDEIFYEIANEVRRRCLLGRNEDATQEHLLRATTAIPHRTKKDPREITILDPACGSGHFLLYCFALLLVIYEEAYDDPDLEPGLRADYPTKDDLRRAVPGLILRHNLHGIDIDLRCTQIAALALWLRCQRAYQEIGLKKDRPRITKSSIVCAEPMPGESEMLKEVVENLEPKLLGQLVMVVFNKMKLAGEAGSLLKIEEEIRDSLIEARRQWRLGPVATQMSLFGEQIPVVRQQRFDLSGIDDAEFFERAEAKVLDALRSYAERARLGDKLQRRLFTDDAVQGFSFIELYYRRFDIVLMNPPFGNSSRLAKRLVERAYPRTKSDLYAAFVERGVSVLTHAGLCGCITSNPFLNLSSPEHFRNLALNEFRLMLIANLGYDVMDDATVPAACTVVGKPLASESPPILFIEARDVETRSSILSMLRLDDRSCIHLLAANAISSLPQSIFAYWLSPNLRQALSDSNRLGSYAHCQFGLHSRGNDDQMFRTWWEIPPSVDFNVDWPIVKLGGDPEHFYRDSHYVIDWRNDGHRIREIAENAEGGTLSGLSYYFRSGLSYIYASRTTFSVQPLEKCSVFSAAAHGCFPYDERDLLLYLGFLNSEPVRLLLKVINPDRFFQSNYVKLLPIPDLEENRAALERAALDALEVCRNHAQGDECSRLFVTEWSCTADLKNGVPFHATKGTVARTIECLALAKSAVDQASIEAYGLGVEDMILLQRHTGASTARCLPGDQLLQAENARPLAESHLSYICGCVYGRWDIRFATGELPRPDLPDPFDMLPVCPPGTLRGPGGLPAKIAPQGYMLRVDVDGILVDDPDHTDDIIRRVRDVLEVIWKDREDAIEKEACEILGVSDLRDYFRRPGAGGFWDDHVKRYAKSRRKAPVYWLLQSSKKNYALWIYYHRLDKDILFKALLNYVEPKIRKEESRLDELRSQKTALGSAAKGGKKIDKDIDCQETLISELRDFEDKLRRAANLHLDPDLNDGVVLNIAPLRELVPWKEAKSYWDDLMDGKYEWSSIGKQLREKSMVHGP